MEIRNFTDKDAHACIEIMQQNEEHMGDLYTVESLVKAAGYTNYFVAVDEGKIIGMIGFSDLNNGIGMLGSLCVNKEIHGKGTGKLLVRKVVEFAKEKKFRKVLLLTHEKNKAMMGLAIREDFIPEGSLKKHFRDGKDVIYFSYFIE